ncbi:MAG: hypothetical protein ABI862_20000, partial [Ilumatobacteraceae bacterium]
MDSSSEPTEETFVGVLSDAGLQRGGFLAIAMAAQVGVGVSMGNGWAHSIATDNPVDVARQVELAFRPRWIVWGSETTRHLVEGGLRVAKCWHIAAVQRLLVGGWRMDDGRVWAQLHELSVDELPVAAAIDLFTAPDDSEPDEALRSDGYLKPEWMTPDFEWTGDRLARWAQLAAEAAVLQGMLLATLGDRPKARETARSESAAELLCAELSADGLPMDRTAAEAIVASFVGARPRTEQEAVEQRRARDAAVLCHSSNPGCDLRNPAQVKSLLRGIG